MTSSRLLGDTPLETFLADYWQKKPLLIRNAVPGFNGFINPDDLAALSMRQDLSSRLVMQGQPWRVEKGPFKESALTSLPSTGWSLIVHDINFVIQQADDLLHSFNFIPKSRLDDLMVSLAPPGGGLGAHYDSYDVFLLQGLGRKRWQISQQSNLELVENAPLNLLSNFQVEAEWILEPGDMLYLPPHVAHNGIALDLCMTYSIGFRAPEYNEFFQGFITYLSETLEFEGRYGDPDLAYSKNPAAIPENLIADLSGRFKAIQWGHKEIIDFLGRYLSEPKSHVLFKPPKRPLNLATFKNRALHHGIRLASAARLLFHSDQYWLNGDLLKSSSLIDPNLKILADTRSLSGKNLSEALVQNIYPWYLEGIIHLDGAA
ncbi:MAG TPA: cupin domain-containing protein [Burkholderiales bacterium]|nr:cupin domain-containing protein [Burkholderiales bacterium]